MPSSFARPQDGGTSPRRLGPLALTIALHLLVAGLLIVQKAAPLPERAQERLTTLFLPEATEEEGADVSERPERREPERKAGEKADEPRPEPPADPPPAPEEAPPPPAPNWLTMSSAEFAASNIANMPRHRRSTPGDAADSASAYGPGEGPGGVRLYDPDWYRRPTGAELAGYLPANAPRKGWGLIACRTIEDYRVDSCTTLGESPLGSGFGRAVREAAWQFRVLPPRINGKPVIGAWVRIRISYGETGDPG